MTLLPIAPPTTPANGATAGEAATTSGDFATLLALVAGTAPAPTGNPVLPELAMPPAETPEPQPDQVESGRDPAVLPDAVAVVALPMPVRAATPAARPIPSPSQLAERPGVRVPASAVAVEASPALAATPRPSTFEALEAPPPPAPPSAPPTEVPLPPVAEVPPVPVAAKPSSRPPVTVPASRAAVEASPVLAEFSPALVAAPPVGEESPVVPENLLSEHRVVEKPLPHVDVPALAPLPTAVVRTEAALPADAPAPPPLAPPAVPEQIVSAVVPLHGRGDGRHEVTLELRPEDLGPIRVEVTVEQQTVHLTLHAAEPATGRLLSSALAELRTALADAGLRAGHVAVSPDSGSGTGRRSRPEPPQTETTRGDSTTPERVRTVRPSAAGRLDLLL